MARSITTRSINPKIMDDNIKILDDAIGALDAPEAEDVSYDNAESGLTADDVQSAIDELNAEITKHGLSSGASVTVETTDFIPITMTSNGYLTIFTLSSGGLDSIDIALNTEGTNLIRLGTANGAYQFASVYLPKGASVYVKASDTNIGGYLITSIV